MAIVSHKPIQDSSPVDFKLRHYRFLSALAPNAHILEDVLYSYAARHRPTPGPFRATRRLRA